MKFLINQLGSVEDIRCSLRFGQSREDLEAALQNEKENKDRETVKKMLTSAIKKLDK